MITADRQHQPISRWLGLCLLCSAFFIDVMGATSVFTASPDIERALRLSPADLLWSITAATLPAGSLLLAGGRLADLFGRRRMFVAGLVLFIAASLACGTAANGAELIAARASQGVAGALLMPAALGLIIGTFTEERDRNRALAAWSAIGGAGATAGLLLGGLVTDGLGWRWVFLINVPAGLVMLVLCPLVLSEPSVAAEQHRTDLAGTVTFSAGIALLIYAMAQIPSLGWLDWRTSGAGAAAVLVLASFGRIEARAAEPIVPPRLLRSRSVVAGNGTLLAAGFTVDGLLFALTLYLQQGRGYSPLQYGGLTAVMAVASIGAAWVAQRALTRFATGRVAATGLALLALTAVLFVVSTIEGGLLVTLVAGMVVFGCGMGAAFVAGTVASVQVATEEDAGVAAAVQNISFTVGSTFGVAVLSTVVAASRVAARAGHQGVAHGARNAFAADAVLLVVCLAAAVLASRVGASRRGLADVVATGNGGTVAGDARTAAGDAGAATGDAGAATGAVGAATGSGADPMTGATQPVTER